MIKHRPSLTSTFIGLILTSGICAAAQSSLPPNVQADVLKTKIVDAFQAGRPNDALLALEQYHQLESKGVTMPPVLLYYEAKAAEQIKDPMHAYEALGRFLSIATPSDQNYDAGVRWYAQMESSAAVKNELAARQAVADQQKEDARNARDERIRANQDSPECQSIARQRDATREPMLAGPKAQQTEKQRKKAEEDSERKTREFWSLSQQYINCTQR